MPEAKPQRKKHHLSEFNVPGLLWVLVLMGLMYFAPSVLPDVYIPYLPFVVGIVCVLINYFFPHHPRVKEMRSIAQILLHATPDSPTHTTVVITTTTEDGVESTKTYVAEEELDEAAKGSALGNILWG